MDTYTSMAVDAFRKQEQARRRLAKAETEASTAARLVPKEQKTLWFLATEIVRVEEDQKEAKAQNDRETYDWCAEYLTDLRRELREEEAKLAAQK